MKTQIRHYQSYSGLFIFLPCFHEDEGNLKKKEKKLKYIVVLLVIHVVYFC